MDEVICIFRLIGSGAQMTDFISSIIFLCIQKKVNMKSLQQVVETYRFLFLDYLDKNTIESLQRRTATRREQLWSHYT